MLAPLVVFCYNRLDYLQQTLLNLEKCELCDKTNLIIVSDGYKSNSKKQVIEVRDYLDEYCKISKFNNVTIINNEVNKGLGNNIIQNVSEILNNYGRIIVVEDDVIVAPYFIKFMNDALDYFKENKNIFSVGGLTLPMNLPNYYNKDLIKTQRVSSICWGIWNDRWNLIDWNMPDYKRFQFSIKQRKSFNEWGKDRSSMLDDQMNKKINSWAIRFDYYMWKNNMYNIIPIKTLANHIGENGTHSKNANINNMNSMLWKECNNIIMEDVDIDNNIKKEFNKRFYISDFNLLKMFLSNLIYRKK